MRLNCLKPNTQFYLLRFEKTLPAVVLSRCLKTGYCLRHIIMRLRLASKQTERRLKENL